MRKFLIVVFSILLSCCAKKVVEQPENLIPKEQMVAILYDLAVINAAKASNPKILEKYMKGPMDYVYGKYGIDSLQFVQSDIYYASLPDEYESIYEQVSARIKTEKDRIEKLRKRTSDSLKNLNKERRKQSTTLKPRKIEQDTLP